jgi:hypothetical protein
MSNNTSERHRPLQAIVTFSIKSTTPTHPSYRRAQTFSLANRPLEQQATAISLKTKAAVSFQATHGDTFLRASASLTIIQESRSVGAAPFKIKHNITKRSASGFWYLVYFRA